MGHFLTLYVCYVTIITYFCRILCLSPGSFDWISALRAVQIRSLVKQESIQLSLFDEHNIAEISSEDDPGERLIACHNPMLAAERAKTREELLQATETEISKIFAATTRQKKRLTHIPQIFDRI